MTENAVPRAVLSLLELGRWSEGETELRRILRAEPKNATVAYCLAFSLCSRHQFTSALTFCDTAIKAGPCPEAETLRDSILRMMQPEFLHDENAAQQMFHAMQYAEAEALYRGLLETAPCNASAAYHLALCLRTQGRLAEALSLCERVLRIGPFPRAHALHASLHKLLGTPAPQPEMPERSEAVSSREMSESGGPANAIRNRSSNESEVIVIECPQCRGKLRIDAKYAGQAGNCKRCGARIELPPMARLAAASIPSSKTDPYKAAYSIEQNQDVLTYSQPYLEVLLATGASKYFVTRNELYKAILAGEVEKSLCARKIRYVKGQPAFDANWSTVEAIAVADNALRSLYRPVEDAMIKGFLVGGVVVMAFNAMATGVYVYSLQLAPVFFTWLLVAAFLGSFLLTRKAPLAPMFVLGVVGWIGFKLGSGELYGMFFGMLTSIVLQSFLFGSLPGAMVGTIVGHFRKYRIPRAPDAEPEPTATYVWGIVVPFIAFVILFLLYVWFLGVIMDWLDT